MSYHRVVRDHAGFGGHVRLTCFSPGCSGATLLRQPYMNDAEWTKRRTDFLRDHPTDRIEEEQS